MRHSCGSSRNVFVAVEGYKSLGGASAAPAQAAKMNCLKQIASLCGSSSSCGGSISSTGGIIHIDASRLVDFQKGLSGNKLMFMKGFGQNDWGPLDSFDGFLQFNSAEMLNQIQNTVKLYGLTSDDYIAIDGDPTNAGFQVFVYWVAKETRCKFIWAKKLPAQTLPAEDQEKAKAKMWAGVKDWATKLEPFNTKVYFVEISHEAQDEEMLRVFGKTLLPSGAEQRPKFNAAVTFFDHGGALQLEMKKGGSKPFMNATVEAYAQEVKGYSNRGPMEFCAFENAAKGLVIRSILKPYAQRNLTLLIGGGQASVLEVAAFAATGEVNPDTELAVFPALRGRTTDPQMIKVVPQWVK